MLHWSKVSFKKVTWDILMQIVHLLYNYINVAHWFKVQSQIKGFGTTVVLQELIWQIFSSTLSGLSVFLAVLYKHDQDILSSVCMSFPLFRWQKLDGKS